MSRDNICIYIYIYLRRKTDSVEDSYIYIYTGDHSVEDSYIYIYTGDHSVEDNDHTGDHTIFEGTGFMP